MSAPHRRPPLDCPQLAAVPRSQLARESASTAAPGPRALPARFLPVGCWFERLTDYLPNPFIHARASDLAALHADGCSAGEAAFYARIHLLAPDICAPYGDADSAGLGGAFPPLMAPPAAPDTLEDSPGDDAQAWRGDDAGGADTDEGSSCADWPHD